MPKIINVMICVASLSGAAVSAGPIEVDIFGDGSNKGFTLDSAGYGLQWMDFNINNKSSATYREVMAELESGGIYEGWREATYEDVVALWSELFLGMANTETETINSDGYFFSRGLPEIGPSLTSSPALAALTEITGFVDEADCCGSGGGRMLLGFFRNKHGDIDQAVLDIPYISGSDENTLIASIDEWSFISWFDWLVAEGYEPLPFYDIPLAAYSVMLVRDTPVPLPGSWLLWLGTAGAIGAMRGRSSRKG